jgi:imidazolonepropionase-like amidohydrolase
VMQQLEATRAYARAGAARVRDLVLEALVPVIEGRVPLFTRASTERDIRDAVAFADRARVRIVISGASEAALVAPLLAERNIPVILDTVLTLPTREDLAHDASYSTASTLAKAGVRFAFAAGETDDVENVRLLPYHAARSVAWGLPRERAIEAMTIDAARILGVDDKVGSIETGKLANLVISRGDPLEVKTPITHVIIGGRRVSLENRQLTLYERYKERP